MRLIDADALHDRLQNIAYDDWNQGVGTTWAKAFDECADIVEDAPTIEPKNTDTFTHTNDEESIISIPTSENSVIVKQYELTDDCIERIADAVVWKLKAEKAKQIRLGR